MNSENQVSLDSYSDNSDNSEIEQKQNQIKSSPSYVQVSQNDSSRNHEIQTDDQDSDNDSQIMDLKEEKMSSENSSDESAFEYQDPINTKQDSENSDDQLRAKIFQQENQDQNIEDEDQSQKIETKCAKDFEGPKIRVNLRDYQKTLFQKSQDKNSIVYLPTGLGKTRIAIALMYYYLSYTQKKKIVFLANTVQLVKQQGESIKRTLYGILQNKNLCKELNKKHGGSEVFLDWNWERICREVACIHGEKNEDIGQTKKKRIQSNLMSKKEFLRKFEHSTIIVIISQMFLNCLRRGFIKLTNFSFIVFDECHHCTGDHPYARIMNEFYFQFKAKLKAGKVIDKNQTLPKIMGLTASPISDAQKNQKKLEEKIQKLCINMDSNFVEYPQNQNKNQTQIKILLIKQTEEKKQNPWLLNFFSKNFKHNDSYQKIKYHFPLYFDCVKEVIDLMSFRHESLKLVCSAKELPTAELFFFYDIKDCLLSKIKDLWLELGEYAMCLALGDMIAQLKNVNGLKDPLNQQLLVDIIQILLKHERILQQQFCFHQISEKYLSAKLLKLIEILNPKNTEDLSDQNNDSVLVFAFKRRTVEYLDKFFSKYREKLPENKKKYFQCTGVTGYSIKHSGRVLNEGVSYETNPSAEIQSFQIQQTYTRYLEEYRENIQKMQGASNALQSELHRFRTAKISKFLLQTQQKYASQLKKIWQFRKREKRVLVSTSVTQEGFDIPICNKVISFDTPFSMKSYIQIKGRARKENSIYYIFTTEVNYQKMRSDKEIYDDTINATYEIAINRIAKKQIRAEEKKQRDGYEKVMTKGGALLNTNYALQILKIYLAALAQPNKGYFHYINTPNIGYKCIIKMPNSDPSGKSPFEGKTCKKKDLALKSAAFNAVMELKKLGLIKDDLRPSKSQDLQDHYELQKYNDLESIEADEQYKQIFQTYAQFEEYKEETGNRTFLKTFFKAIRQKELDFIYINPKFERAFYDFSNKEAKFPFQLYHVSFSNTHNYQFMKENDKSNEIGLLTCFDEHFNAKLFSNFNYKFEENPNESFQFKKITTELWLTSEEYRKLRGVHEFLVAGCDNKEISYYINETRIPVQNRQYQQIQREATYVFDKTRQFYPILILLKGDGANKNQKKYQIDHYKTEKIRHHTKIFKQLYKFNNRPKFSKFTEKFTLDLTQDFEGFAQTIQGNENITLVQSISCDFLFHKCLIKKMQKYSQNLINQFKKGNLRQHNLQKRSAKFQLIFKHFKSTNNDLIQRILWRQYLKENRKKFFDQGGIRQQQLKNQKFYFIKQFLEYPISPQTLFKFSLAKQYVYEALNSYTKALAFLNIKLRSLFEARDKKDYRPLKFEHYENIILANSDLIFQHLADYGNSKILREIGRSYKSKNSSMSFNQSFSTSQIQNLMDISEIQNKNLNQTSFQDASISLLNITQSKPREGIQLSSNKRVYEFSDKFLDKLQVRDIQKVLTTKTSKHNRNENYEVFEFIGDVVLKYLATVQIFCTRPDAVEGQMHIARANIICNANLHKKSIKAEIFRYIMASKHDDVCPPYKFNYDESKVKTEKYTGKNNLYQYLNIMKVNKASEAEGYQYISGKVHADVVQALIGAFYIQKSLEDCQQLLYALNILISPSLQIDVSFKNAQTYPDNLPLYYQELQKSIGYSFTCKGLLIQALTHSSFKNTLEIIVDDRNLTRILQRTKNQIDKFNFISEPIVDYRTKIRFYQTFYERLQFLGDSVLDLIVVEHLFEKYDENFDEGALTLLKQAGVSNKSLGLIALKFRLHELMLMDIPELDNLQKQFSKLRMSFDDYIAHPEKLQLIQINQIKLLGDVFEGLVGAIFVDNNFNYPKTKEIVWKMIGKYIEIFTDKNHHHLKGSTANFLKDNGYNNCRIDIISKQVKNDKFLYGLLDRKHSVIEKCFAANEKDAWDSIMDKIEAKQKGTYNEDDDSDA